ncbi:EAL domain-containing protein [Fusibacter paucivorans]|uniref:EAL domain-containing protein n=1 Tax=Fusibacter paucivorans TaxID=76009 RepID=A0ABS5PQ47_9FIRM|nr:EAL domain-containing protein [Fusibacter paucivorans]MBS7526491.1 EAL domain-containing protein [Fusibacter paucivorans]
MIGFNYMLTAFFAYGLLFSLIYLQIKYRPLSLKRAESPIRRGLMLGSAAVFLMVLVDLTAIQDMSDGRFAILILAIVCYDLSTALIPFGMINAYIFLIQRGNVIESFVATLLTIVIAEVYRHYIYKRPHRYISLALTTIVIGVANIMTTMMIAPNNPYLNMVENNMFAGLSMFALVVVALCYLVDSERHIHRQIEDLYLAKEDLETQNEEIRTLYDNVRQAELSLKQNYETLDEYRWRLETSEKRYERVLDASCEGFFDYYPITKVWFLSKRFCELLSYPESESNRLAIEWFEHIPLIHKSVEMYFNSAAVWPDDRVISLEIQIADKHGYLKWFLFNAIADIDGFHRLQRVTGSILDIHQRKIEQEKVEFYAFHDPITGFLNADYFTETMKKYMLTSNESLLVFYVSIARYDKLMQVYGKKVIEALQYQLGNDIKNIFGHFSIFSVIQAGTFGVLVLQKDQYYDTLVDGVAALSRQYERPVHIFNVDVQCTLMFPYYEYRGNETTETILDRLEETRTFCDETHYYGKLKAFDWDYFNRKVFVKEISAYLRTAMMESLFEVYYQPQIKYENGVFSIWGFEALVRLRHPNYGMISPDVFIGLAEELGEIHRIDEIVLEKALGFGRKIVNGGQEIGIAVNLSYIELLNTEHIRRIIDKIVKARREGIYIAIEITESAIAKYIDEVSDNLEAFRKASIEIHLDDFGTGYSSLSQLAELPISTLKIDRTFIDGMMTRSKVLSLVETMLKLGSQLELQIIAEGIETEAQLEQLIAFACSRFQGYFFAKPLKEKEAIALLQKGIDVNLFDRRNQLR